MQSDTRKPLRRRLRRDRARLQGFQTGSSPVIYIRARLDTRTGQYILLWRDIQQVFPDVGQVRNVATVAQFLIDGDFALIHPLRIKYLPGVIFNVVLKDTESAPPGYSPPGYTSPGHTSSGHTSSGHTSSGHTSSGYTPGNASLVRAPHTYVPVTRERSGQLVNRDSGEFSGRSLSNDYEFNWTTCLQNPLWAISRIVVLGILIVPFLIVVVPFAIIISILPV
ncbi:hypothetical protein B0O80DRAFT_527213 [Mortierella sp. GBAus27b]|nr:hypothetical protein B0O80DRAFT_527213 [Mortierella sp. GBAus27b]